MVVERALFEWFSELLARLISHTERDRFRLGIRQERQSPDWRAAKTAKVQARRSVNCGARELLEL
jgi:hypothetical protein